MSIRKVLGYVDGNERSIGVLKDGARVHFAPAFLNTAGWNPAWRHTTMTVRSLTRTQHGNAFHFVVDKWTDRYRVFVLDQLGRYIEDRGENPFGINRAARVLFALVLPIFVDENEQTLCPFCGKATRYHLGADYCDTKGHGVLPNPHAYGLVRQLPEIEPTWIAEGPPAVPRRRVIATIGAGEIQAALHAYRAKAVQEGDTCTQCMADRYEWVNSTLRCPACWFLPLKQP